MLAIVLERNKMVNRKLVRLLTCAGYQTIACEDPGQIFEHVPKASLLCADAFDGDVVVRALKDNPPLRGILWTAEPIKRSLRYALGSPQLGNLLGRKDFESTPRPWELVMVARRLLRPTDPAPPFSAYLDWGFSGFQEQIATTGARDEVVQKVQRFVSHLGAPKRVAEMFAELGHEMLMNAMYDAPVDASGAPKYALDRKADLDLPAGEQPTLRMGSDGCQLALQVSDPFGRLTREHVFAGLARGLDGGQMDTSHGGAGLGMVVCHNSTVAMFYDVVRGRQTEVTGIFDLDMNLREFRTQAKSLHFFEV